MKSNSKLKATKEPARTEKLVVQEINIQSTNRSQKDIGYVKTVLHAAESVSFPNRVGLYDLYEDALLDGSVTGAFEKRIEAVLNKNLYFCNADGKRINQMDDVIGSEVFRSVVKKIMETPAYGISGMEFVPGAEFTFKEIPRKHIKPHKKILAIEQNEDSGISYENVSNIWIVGEEKDLGYLLKCSLYAVYKRGALADYAQYVELFGQPVRIIYYDAYDTKTKMELRKVLDETGSSLAMMLPKQAQFEMKDGKESNANGELQLKFLKYCDDEILVIILGNTETTKSSESSGYAQSKTHDKQQEEKTKSDMKYVLNKLNSNQFFRILKSYGFPVEGGRFKFDSEIDLEYLATKIKIDVELAKLGVKFSDDYMYNTYNIPKPANYDELKAKDKDESLDNDLEEELLDEVGETLLSWLREQKEKFWNHLAGKHVKNSSGVKRDEKKTKTGSNGSKRKVQTANPESEQGRSFWKGMRENLLKAGRLNGLTLLRFPQLNKGKDSA